MGFLPFTVSFTVFRCVFMLMSTPAAMKIRPHAGFRFYMTDNARFWCSGRIDDVDETVSVTNAKLWPGSPKMVPCTTVPFFSSIVTVSFDNFMRNLHAVAGMGE